MANEKLNPELTDEELNAVAGGQNDNIDSPLMSVAKVSHGKECDFQVID